MSRRPIDGSSTNESPNKVTGSVFDSKAPLRLPKGTPRDQARKARAVFAENPYLEQAQVPAVIRLVILREKFDDAQKQIDAEGFTIVNRFDEEKPNPMLDVLTRLQSALVTQERALAIAVPTRNEQIGKKDRQQVVPKQRAATGRGQPKLRLA